MTRVNASFEAHSAVLAWDPQQERFVARERIAGDASVAAAFLDVPGSGGDIAPGSGDNNPSGDTFAGPALVLAPKPPNPEP